MEAKNFFEEVALACRDEASKIRQTMYLIMNSEKTIEQTRETMIDSIVANFMGKVDDHKLHQLFNSQVGYTDREFNCPTEKTTIYELISASLSFPEMGKGFMLKPVGHYFREDDLVEIFNDYDSFARAINKMNENFADPKIVKTFKGPNTHCGNLIELYLVGGQCLINEVKKKH